MREALASGRRGRRGRPSHTLEQPGLRGVTVDLTDPSAARELVDRLQPEWIINCAGFANVDECERDGERAELLNVELPRNLAAACAHAGVGLVHISTDSVFDGERGGYAEEDEPAPLNVYASSKLQGEQAVQAELPEALILRTNFIGIHSPAQLASRMDRSPLESGERFRASTM